MVKAVVLSFFYTYLTTIARFQGSNPCPGKKESLFARHFYFFLLEFSFTLAGFWKKRQQPFHIIYDVEKSACFGYIFVAALV